MKKKIISFDFILAEEIEKCSFNDKEVRSVFDVDYSFFKKICFYLFNKTFCQYNTVHNK